MTDSERATGEAREFDVEQVIPRDAIPSVDEPEYAGTYEGDPADEVIAVTVEAESGADTETRTVARAYPVRYLHYHEIVNDRLGGVPIAVTWCPLCGSAVVYDRRVEAAGDGEAPEVLTFGVSGKLAADDLVMYDRETDSEWKQSLGEAIAGPLAGTELDVRPASLTTWERFRDDYPAGDVLARPGGESEAAGDAPDPEPIEYDEAPYEAYFETEGFGLDAHRGTGTREWDREDLDPKDVVLGVEIAGDALGFPRRVVAGDDESPGAAGHERGVVTATVGGVDVVVFATEDGIHAFENPGYEWRDAPGGFRASADSGGALFDGVTGEPVDAPAAHTGESGSVAAEPLARLPSRRLFAFAWQDDHGPDAFYLGADA
ncbi:DUF3179 domain-containing protein [Haloparvum sp. PAK95]|uniref:DUF3179 domain-containing protein n=1 Tax=Haloparvum sp. PAK95 TaxID=3418962 RepID=UPI003D2EBA32